MLDRQKAHKILRVLEHGSHDQKDHGNWAKGKGKSTRDRITPQNTNEKALLNYLNQVAGIRGDQPPKGFKYSGPENLVLEHGQFFTPPKKGDRLLKGYTRGKAKECYGNSIKNIRNDLTYTEGYATNTALDGFGFAHAWLTTPDGKVIDPTWEPGTGTAYFGVRMNTDFVLKTTLRTKKAGIIANDWMDNNRLMKQGFPKGVLDALHDS